MPVTNVNGIAAARSADMATAVIRIGLEAVLLAIGREGRGRDEAGIGRSIN